MSKLIDLNEYPVSTVLPQLLKDRTTGENIIFATDAYLEENPAITEKTPMTKELLLGLNSCDIQPRVLKSLEAQAARTKKKAEVFTPAWICNKMNNHCDTEWFGRENVFNVEKDNGWTPIEGKIKFPEGKTWHDYINSTRLEITCGEAPYIVSRYDAATGELIPIENRIGILDRKIRIINEHSNSKKEWYGYVYQAFKSVYGYEFQGDNLLIARINLLMTFCDYAKARWGEEPTQKQLFHIVDIITWNIWQMDGLRGVVPNGGMATMEEDFHQINFFELLGINESVSEDDNQTLECLIYDWDSKQAIKYNDLKRG